ncbi:MAG TPA: tRNA uridine-5-carboxymethylaminomethyl(34) synthesis GTPase MnmE [Opitutaceae bacterium]|jgi:tRNA modification GTPase
MARQRDTIAAPATPAGVSALALIRISGYDTLRVAKAALGRAPSPRVATHGDYTAADGAVLDDVVATLLLGPNSYTGEDTLEISCHGNPLIVRGILADLMARGCRPASPGEFTQRAFLEGRMDLSQAEAVMDVISARSESALAAARQVLRGALGRHVAAIVCEVVAALATVEAYIDFPDENLPSGDNAAVRGMVEGALAGAGRLLATERTGALLRDGIRTVIIGEPNAGKSSLMNRILGSDRSIVSAEPGTTRDFIAESVSVGPHGLRLVDTAGLNASASGVEKLGVEKTIEQAREADLLVLVLDATRPSPSLPDAIRGCIRPDNTIAALNKADLLGARAPAAEAPAGIRAVRVSAQDGAGLPELLASIGSLAAGIQTTFGEEHIAVNVRHAHYLGEANSCLAAAKDKLDAGGASELLASDLRGALAALGEISGRVDNERMLDQLFATFCIGK